MNNRFVRFEESEKRECMLKDKKLFLLDIDGTVCKGKQLFSGTREFLRDIKENGGQFVFITNNATKSISAHCKLAEKGLHLQKERKSLSCIRNLLSPAMAR